MRRGLLAPALAGASLLFGGAADGREWASLSAPHAAAWRVVGPGIELGARSVEAAGEGRWTELRLLRLDPRRVRLRLQTRLNADLSRGEWTVDSASGTALAAFNAGQFSDIVPWGWTVMDGLEIRPPGNGPLSQAVVLDSSGSVRFVPPDSVAEVRAAGGVELAFQSYPSLLIGDGEIPAALSTPGEGVGITHRDARLAICQLLDGRLLVLLTRFEGLGEAGGGIPFGLTLAETAELLRAEGCRRAVALDGGISAQLAVREADGQWQAWRAWRKVPLGVLVEAR
jgi:hypothetical protein